MKNNIIAIFSVIVVGLIIFAVMGLIIYSIGHTEIRTDQYQEIQRLVNDQPSLASVVDEAMKDGKITIDEYQHILDKHKQAIKQEVQQAVRQ